MTLRDIAFMLIGAINASLYWAFALHPHPGWLGFGIIVSIIIAITLAWSAFNE